ncbi:MAG: hypothetical protein ACLRTA_00640 [Clostridia bacterium]
MKYEGSFCGMDSSGTAEDVPMMCVIILARMTALFTTHRFYDKALFGVIVSGYSGGDIVAEQLISGLNMNKTFALPGKFAILETANSPGEILQIPGIEEKAAAFADQIRNQLKGRESHD